MILTPTDISTRSSSTSIPETSPSATEKGFTSTTKEFGLVMSTLRAQQATSGTAPQTLGFSETSAADPDLLSEQTLTDMLNLTSPLATSGDAMVLTAFHLGPHLQIITPQSAAPEGQSLEVFARSQGFDEVALQWLMGSTSTTLAQTTSTAEATGLTNTVVSVPGQTQPLSLLGNADAGLAKTSTAPMLATPLPTPSAEIAQNSDRAGTLLPDNLAPLGITSLKFQAGADPLKGTPSWAAASTTTAADWLQGNAMAVNLIKTNVQPKPESTSGSLDLISLLPADLQSTLEAMAMDDFASGQESPSQGQGGFNGRTDTIYQGRSERPSAASDMTEQDSAQRRENINTLAEKMGQAVGQRILSEMERGQWHLKLSLRPATLGHIEVEMRMRSGEMDAVFTAPQALTRELLNEGMSKLKDTLGQMGMDVASLKVDDGQSRQRGGESTPERQANLKDNAPTESADVPASQSISVPHKMGSDGWDVLV